MLFRTLMEKYLDTEIRSDVDRLLELKMTMPEIGEGKRFDRVNDYLDRNIEEIGKVIATLPEEKVAGWDELNQIFLEQLTN